MILKSLSSSYKQETLVTYRATAKDCRHAFTMSGLDCIRVPRCNARVYLWFAGAQTLGRRGWFCHHQWMRWSSVLQMGRRVQCTNWNPVFWPFWPYSDWPARTSRWGDLLLWGHVQQFKLCELFVFGSVHRSSRDEHFIKRECRSELYPKCHGVCYYWRVFHGRTCRCGIQGRSQQRNATRQVHLRR